MKKSKKIDSPWWVEWGKTLCFALVLTVGIRTFLAEVRYIPSSSMEPTLQIKDRLIIEKISGRFGDFQKGDIVVFDPSQQNAHNARNTCPITTSDAFIKRVIAGPGDTLGYKNLKVNERNEILDFDLSINDVVLREDYLKDSKFGFPLEALPFKIPANEYFVMGDNRNHSCDGRMFGTIKKDQIIGKAIFRFLPFDRIGIPYN